MKATSRGTMILAIVLLVALAVAVTFAELMGMGMGRQEPFTNHSSFGFPKTIWTYWSDASSVPDTVNRCIGTWKKHNPSYRVVVLDDGAIKRDFGYDLDVLASTAVRKSDYARLIALSTYGGFWLDATIVLTQPLEWIQDIQESSGCEFFGYYAPFLTDDMPVIESWFFACVAGSAFVDAWFQEFMTIPAKHHNDDHAYIAHKKAEGHTFERLEAELPYLCIHLSALVVQQKHKGYRLHLQNAVADDGPFMYLDRNSWKQEEAFAFLCSGEGAGGGAGVMPVIKLRGDERKYLERNPQVLKCLLAE